MRQAKSTTKTIYTYVPDKKIQKQFCVLFTEETTSRQMNWSKVQEKVTRDPWTVGLNKIKKEAGKNSNIFIPQMIIGLLFTYYPLPPPVSLFSFLKRIENFFLWYSYISNYIFCKMLSIHPSTFYSLPHGHSIARVLCGVCWESGNWTGYQFPPRATATSSDHLERKK